LAHEPKLTLHKSPPDRQIIYLDVSRPKGLIILGRAVGGGLSDRVASWIRANLDLRTTIPKLEMQADGKILGGKVSGGDILDECRELAQRPPGVLVGPDSIPTLSFTSGSEGKPKGVLGRHYSLVYYFPWMAETFGLSSSDRFTMVRPRAW
jgi:L-2-aminoadipate reductase